MLRTHNNKKCSHTQHAHQHTHKDTHQRFMRNEKSRPLPPPPPPHPPPPTPTCCCLLPAARLGGRRILHCSLFYVLRKSWGGNYQARWPAFVTDGKPFRGDYDAPRLALIPISFRAQVSMICQRRRAGLWRRCAGPASGLTQGRMKLPVMTSPSVSFTAVRRHNDIAVAFEMHPAGPCYCCQADDKKVLSVARRRWPLGRGSLRRPPLYWAIEGFQQI